MQDIMVVGKFLRIHYHQMVEMSHGKLLLNILLLTRATGQWIRIGRQLLISVTFVISTTIIFRLTKSPVLAWHTSLQRSSLAFKCQASSDQAQGLRCRGGPGRSRGRDVAEVGRDVAGFIGIFALVSLLIEHILRIVLTKQNIYYEKCMLIKKLMSQGNILGVLLGKMNWGGRQFPDRVLSQFISIILLILVKFSIFLFQFLQWLFQCFLDTRRRMFSVL